MYFEVELSQLPYRVVRAVLNDSKFSCKLKKNEAKKMNLNLLILKSVTWVPDSA